MKTTPKILSRSIFAFADDDHFAPQAHEREDDSGGGGGSGQTDTSSPEYIERKKKFMGGFQAPPSTRGEVTKEQVDQARKEDAEKAKIRAEQSEESKKLGEEAEKKRAGSNVPKIIEDKRKAEAELTEVKTKLSEYETKIKPELDAKIAELQSKIDSGDFSPKKEQEFQEKITKIETEKKEREDSLVNENQQLRSRLSYYDIQEDPVFKQKYLEPVYEAHREAVEAVGDDKALQAKFIAALNANAMALQATTPEQRRTAEAQRNDFVSQIAEGLDSFTGEGFRDTMRAYFRASQNHALALSKHEETKKSIEKEARRRGEEAEAEQLATWDKAYKVTKNTHDVKLSEEEEKVAKDLGLKVDIEMQESDLLASKVVVGKSQMVDAVDMVARGRVHPVLTAKIKIQAHIIQEQKELIEKLRAGGTAGGETKNSEEKPETGTREQFHKRFSANRPGLKRA
jgi:hypothetical protein